MRAIVVLLALVPLLVRSAALSDALTSRPKGFTIQGKVLWPDDLTSAAKVKLILSTDGMLQKYAWPQPDGKFAIHNVPAGSHLLDIAAIGLTYPQLRLDVSAQGGGRVLATLADNDLQRLPDPLIIRPVAVAEYFERQVPFNVIGFLKTPYGLMIIFALLAVFVLPQLKVDPEEYQEMMRQNAGTSAPAVTASPQRRR